MAKEDLLMKLFNKNKKQKNNVDGNNVAQPSSQIFSVAIIIDGVVEDIIRCQERFYHLILSNPAFIAIDDNTGPAKLQDKFNQLEKTFYNDEE